MALTLNQVINRIKVLALSHKQIRSFYRGAPTDFDIQGGAGDVEYPACFCEKLAGATNRSDHQHTYNFRLYFFDLINVAEGTDENQQDVLSDMDSVALDVISMMMSSVYEYEWEVVDNSSEDSEVHQSGDMVGGSVREVSIKIPFLADRCQVPAEDVTFENDFDMARTRLFSYTAPGTDDTTFTPTDDETGVTLAGKIVLSVYRAGMYKRPITTSPTDTEHIMIAGSLLSDRKGILSSTGEVDLGPGDKLIANEIIDFLIWE